MLGLMIQLAVIGTLVMVTIRPPLNTQMNFRNWLRMTAIALAVLAGYLAVSVLTFQDSAKDRPTIVRLLSK